MKFHILLEIGCSSTIVMGRLLEKLHLEKNYLMKGHTQAKNIRTNPNVKVDFTLPVLSATNVVTWKFHVYESNKDRFDTF